MLNQLERAPVPALSEKGGRGGGRSKVTESDYLDRSPPKGDRGTRCSASSSQPVSGVAIAATVFTADALAGDPETCKTVRFSDVGWTDITGDHRVASVILTGLGYEPEHPGAVGAGHLSRR